MTNTNAQTNHEFKNATLAKLYADGQISYDVAVECDLKNIVDEEMIQLKQDLYNARKENTSLKQATSSGLGMKVSAKGAVSVYGLGRFPVTLYKGQWEALINRIPTIQAFITANESKLTVRTKAEDKEEVKESDVA
jgi:hypothetical protein